MANVLELVFALIFFGGMLSVGWLLGSQIERRHLRSLAEREAELAPIMVSDMRRLPDNWSANPGVLVHGEAVIATDYFKVFQAGLRKLFGGSVGCYETLVDRARREAMVRMLESARSQGANVVWNVRMTTATVGGHEGKKPGGVEVLVYGTAFHVTAKTR